LKVAFLTKGNTELSSGIINLLDNHSSIDVIKIQTESPRSATIRETLGRCRLRWALQYRKIWREQHPRVVSPKRLTNCVVEKNINSDLVERRLSEFGPDLILISGTKKVRPCILKTATVAVNLHHGFLPYYRGVSSLDWVLKERNFNYFGAMLHIAAPELDEGDVINGCFVTPYPDEPFQLFQRRLFLSGVDLIAGLLERLPKIPTTRQPGNLPTHNFTHREKTAAHQKDVAGMFDNPNLKRYAFLQQHRSVLKQQRRGIGLRNCYLNYKVRTLQCSAIQKGLHIVTYHEIVDDADQARLSSSGVPSIFTSQKNFFSHLEFYKNNFRCVTLSTGLTQLRENGHFEEPVIAICFDDGLRSVLDVIDKLAAAELRPALFLSAKVLNNRTVLNVHKELFSQKSLLDLQKCRQISNSAKKREKAKSPREPTGDWDKYYLRTADIKMLIETNQIDGVGGHTRDHISLADLSEDAQREQIRGDFEELGKAFGLNLKYFSFPFGKLDRMSWRSEFLAGGLGVPVFQCNGGINKAWPRAGDFLRIGVGNESETKLTELLKLQWTR
jgi:methionyl-tRNA formyltransferase